MDYFSFERFKLVFPKILPYLSVTFQFVIVCLILSTILAIIIAVLRIKNIPIIKQLMEVYVSYMRGTPFLVQLMVVYYGLPMLMLNLTGINLNRVNTIFFAEIAMVMNESAFLGEQIRGAILSIPSVQSEAGYSIGMTKTQTFIRIVLPQTIRILVPVFGTTIVGMLQSTSILYMVGVVDIMGRAKSIASSTHHALEAYAAISILYIFFSLLIKLIFNIIERKMSYGRGELE